MLTKDPDVSKTCHMLCVTSGFNVMSSSRHSKQDKSKELRSVTKPIRGRRISLIPVSTRCLGLNGVETPASDDREMWFQQMKSSHIAVVPQWMIDVAMFRFTVGYFSFSFSLIHENNQHIMFVKALYSYMHICILMSLIIKFNPTNPILHPTLSSKIFLRCICGWHCDISILVSMLSFSLIIS